MTDLPHSITLKEYDYDTKQAVEVGEVSIYTLARSMKPEHLAALLDEWLNSIGRGYQDGEKVGQIFQ